MSDIALRCVACNEPLQHFQFSKPLPDGTQDDMCSRCKAEIQKADSVRYKDYVWGTITESGGLAPIEDDWD